MADLSWCECGHRESDHQDNRITACLIVDCPCTEFEMAEIDDRN